MCGGGKAVITVSFLAAGNDFYGWYHGLPWYHFFMLFSAGVRETVRLFVKLCNGDKKTALCNSGRLSRSSFITLKTPKIISPRKTYLFLYISLEGEIFYEKARVQNGAGINGKTMENYRAVAAGTGGVAKGRAKAGGKSGVFGRHFMVAAVGREVEGYSGGVSVGSHLLATF